MNSKVSKDLPTTFQILFRDFCPYCFSREEGIHTCPGVEKKIDTIKEAYNGWNHN